MGGLLVFSNDLGGSITIDQATGKVVNYQDFGGGLSAIFTVFLITMAAWGLVRYFLENYGSRTALASHLLLVLGIKGAILWTIYLSGRYDPRILAEFPFNPIVFILDVPILFLAIFLPSTPQTQT